MARHIWSILCTKAIVDRETNSISLFDSIESLESNKEIVPPPESGDSLIVVQNINMQLVTLWTRSDYAKPETALSRLTLVGPNGKKLRQPDNIIDLTASTRNRVIFGFNGLAFLGFGVYEFLIELQHGEKGSPRWRKVASIPLEWTLNKDATDAPKPKE